MNIEELTKLRDKCLLFNKLMMVHPEMPKEVVSAFEKSNELINEAFKNGKIDHLKAMSNDIDDQVLNHMSLQEASNFKALLKEKYNIDYAIIRKSRVKKLQKIVQKGTISSREDYDFVKERIDEIYNDSNFSEELEKLNHLLVNDELTSYKNG